MCYHSKELLLISSHDLEFLHISNSLKRKKM